MNNRSNVSTLGMSALRRESAALPRRADCSAHGAVVRRRSDLRPVSFAYALAVLLRTCAFDGKLVSPTYVDTRRAVASAVRRVRNARNRLVATLRRVAEVGICSARVGRGLHASVGRRLDASAADDRVRQKEHDYLSHSPTSIDIVPMCTPLLYVVPLVVSIVFMPSIANAQYEGTVNGCNMTPEDPPMTFISNGGQDLPMMPYSTHFCWLATLQGTWSGTGAQCADTDHPDAQGAWVRLNPEGTSSPRDGMWHLVTQDSQSTGVGYCVPKTCFTGASPEAIVIWDQQTLGPPPNYTPVSPWSEGEPAFPVDVSCDGAPKFSPPESEQATGYPGVGGTQSAVTMLAGWPNGCGATNGLNEYAGVQFVPGGPNLIFANNCASNECSPAQGCWGTLEATFISLYVGLANASAPPVTVDYWNTLGPPPNACGNGGGNFVCGNMLVDLGLQYNEGICYLVGIQGGFRDSQVEVMPLPVQDPGKSTTYYAWWAQVQSASGVDVAENIECMTFQQPR